MRQALRVPDQRGVSHQVRREILDFEPRFAQEPLRLGFFSHGSLLGIRAPYGTRLGGVRSCFPPFCDVLLNSRLLSYSRNESREALSGGDPRRSQHRSPLGTAIYWISL